MRDFESHSSITTYCTCPRRYKHKYLDGYVTRTDSRDLRLGKAWSIALDERSVPTNEPISRADLGVLQLLWTGYDAMWGESDRGMETEVPFEYDGFRGKFDGLHEPQNRLQESKLTRSWVNTDYWEQRSIDQQTMMYLHVARCLGYDVHEVTYDVVSRPRIKKRIKQGCRESDKEYLARCDEWIYKNRYDVYQRRTFTWSDEQLLDNFMNMKRVLGTIPLDGDIFAQYKNSCRAYGRICEYMPVCAGESTIEDPELYQLRRAV